MSWNEKRTIRLESERKKALDCLQELLSYAERLEQKKRNSKKRRTVADVRRKPSAGRRRNKFQSNKVTKRWKWIEWKVVFVKFVIELALMLKFI